MIREFRSSDRAPVLEGHVHTIGLIEQWFRLKADVRTSSGFLKAEMISQGRYEHDEKHITEKSDNAQKIIAEIKKQKDWKEALKEKAESYKSRFEQATSLGASSLSIDKEIELFNELKTKLGIGLVEVN